jgi:hypothetical protein
MKMNLKRAMGGLFEVGVEVDIKGIAEMRSQTSAVRRRAGAWDGDFWGI